MYLKRFIKEYKNILIISFLIFFILEILSILNINYMYKRDVNSYLRIATLEYEKQFRTSSNILEDRSDIIYHLIINRPIIRDIMYKAFKSKDKNIQDKFREKLYQKLEPTYKYLNSLKVKLNFHLPGGIDFLRFHKPSRYGDSLLPYRESLNYINHTKTAISCFEQGRIMNAFRNIYPIFRDREFVGTVEISYTFSVLNKELLKSDSASNMFIVKSKILKEKLFYDQNHFYKKSEFSHFKYDRFMPKDVMQLRLPYLHKINREIAKSIDKRLDKGISFSTLYNDKKIYKDKKILVTFIAIPNLNDNTVAYLIHYRFANFIDILSKNRKENFLISILLSALTALILFLLVKNKVDSERVVHELANHDFLTGIYNRHGLNEIVNQKIGEFKRFKRDFSVIFFDIDFFKKVNDTYGHDIGDYVLKNIALIVTENIRKSDIFGRWGGEEFIIFLPETSIEDAISLAEKLRKTIQIHAFYEIESITCSFGVTYLKENESKSSLLKRVDELLYMAKEDGRNCVKSDFIIDNV